MSNLTQSTAVTINLGPFLDASTLALETGLAGTMTVNLSKAGAALVARNSATAISYDAHGCYRVPLNTTDTNTLGPFTVSVSDAATHLPVMKEYEVVLPAAGAGAVSEVVTVTDDDSNPLDGVEVWVTSDIAGTNVVAGSLTTNASGQVTFMLDAGTYYAWKQLSGYNFTNPETLTVTA